MAGATTGYGKKMSQGHVKDDKKILKARIKIEKMDMKNNVKHASDHQKGIVKNKTAIKTLSSQMKNKGKSTGMKTS